MLITGFNLHAEKGKPGQYVGKVDTNSPAELAGLREGDRIIEVNSVDIGSETHRQVVDRIKAVPNETSLLVIDPHTFTPAKNGSVSVPKKDESSASSEKSMNNNNNNNNDHHDDHTDVPVTETDNKVTKENNSAVPSTPENNNTKMSSSSNDTTKTIINNEKPTMNDVDVTQETANHTNNHTTKMTEMTTTTTHDHDKKMNENNSSAANGKKEETKSTNGHVLNLNMTATELRAKLLAKKKYDPKNDSIDLRKKYDIIEKM